MCTSTLKDAQESNSGGVSSIQEAHLVSLSKFPKSYPQNKFFCYAEILQVGLKEGGYLLKQGELFLSTFLLNSSTVRKISNITESLYEMLHFNFALRWIVWTESAFVGQML